MQANHPDLEHLKILSTFHYVLAGLAALFACFPFLHLAVGVGMVVGSGDMGNQDPVLPWAGWFFIAISTIFIVCGWAYAICVALAGRFLSQRRRYTFCLVMAGISCMFFPFGTVLGIFTLILLLREPVKSTFEGQGAQNMSDGGTPQSATTAP